MGLNDIHFPFMGGKVGWMNMVAIFMKIKIKLRIKKSQWQLEKNSQQFRPWASCVKNGGTRFRWFFNEDNFNKTFKDSILWISSSLFWQSSSFCSSWLCAGTKVPAEARPGDGQHRLVAWQYALHGHRPHYSRWKWWKWTWWWWWKTAHSSYQISILSPDFFSFVDQSNIPLVRCNPVPFAQLWIFNQVNIYISVNI